MQDELFDITSLKRMSMSTLVQEIELVAKKIVKDMEYPVGSLGICENETKTEKNYPVQIRELRRSAVGGGDADTVAVTNDGIRSLFVCTPILTIAPMKDGSKFRGCVVMRMSAKTYNAVPLLRAEEIKERWTWVDDDVGVDDAGANDAKTENIRIVEKPDGKKVRQRKILNRYDVFVRIDSSELIPYLERLMRDRLENYKSTEPTYGCCHLYVECSNARKCLSKDKMYATACSYRKNIMAGRFFYGKNKNI